MTDVSAESFLIYSMYSTYILTLGKLLTRARRFAVALSLILWMMQTPSFEGKNGEDTAQRRTVLSSYHLDNPEKPATNCVIPTFPTHEREYCYYNSWV